MNWFEYLTDKVLPKPPERPDIPKFEAEEPTEGIKVEKSTASDSMIVRALNFWKR